MPGCGDYTVFCETKGRMKSSDMYDFVGLFFTESESAAKFQVHLGTECLQKASQNPRCLINMKSGWGAADTP